MIDWTKYDTKRAELRFAIANSPLFLLEGLLSDEEVRRIGKEASTDALIGAFKDALTARSQTLAEQTRPFILIAAAMATADMKTLEALEREASNQGGWIALLATAARERPARPIFQSFHYKPTASKRAPKALREDIPTTTRTLKAL